MPAAQNQRDGGLTHARDQLRDGKSRLNVSADGVEQNQKPVYFVGLLNGGKLRQHMLIFCGFVLRRKHLVPLHLPDHGQAVDDAVG